MIIGTACLIKVKPSADGERHVLNISTEAAIDVDTHIAGGEPPVTFSVDVELDVSSAE
jgi:hypothetical protein